MVKENMPTGDINGALGTIRSRDIGPRIGWRSKLLTFLAVLGPGLIVMVGDNDAGAFSTYAQAGQNYGTKLLWTLLLLIPVLYVNQEMVLRLGSVTGVGHARLILERFGKFWGAFSVVDLFVLNALTIVTEFVGVSLALTYLGFSQVPGVIIAAALVMLAAAQGNFRRFERFAMLLCFGSLILIPVFIAGIGPIAKDVHDTFVPSLPAGDLSTIMLAIIAIVGTTVAPWQLFFQQSYVVDKRITTRFLNYERWDLAVGIVFVMLGAFALVIVAATAFSGHKEFGNFQDTAAVAAGISAHIGHWAGVLFAIGLIDASIIGAAAVSLSTAYAIGDILSIRHSLHGGIAQAPGFYATYLLLIVAAAALVLIPGTPLGLLTNAVQVLAGVLLPSATVFLMLLCNDKSILGPWTNTRRVNAFTGAVIAALITLSIILTASVIFPSLSGVSILWILAIGFAGALGVGLWMAFVRAGRYYDPAERAARDSWRMPPLADLPKNKVTMFSRFWLVVLRGYLVAAVALVIVRVVQIALHGGAS